MAQCKLCGKPIEFVTIDGRPTPLHSQGGCSGPNGGIAGGSFKSAESRCLKTSCNVCGQPVFFIQHNGGSVFIDPPLGPPWYRHGCMPARTDREPSESEPTIGVVSSEAQRLLGRVRGLITGVVVQADVSKRRKNTILTIAVAELEPVVLLMRGGADYFLGKLVILRPAKLAVYNAESPDEVFKVERALFIPEPHRNPEFPLLLEGAARPPSEVLKRILLMPSGQPAAVEKAYRKFLEQGLGASWKAHELASIVQLLDGKTQDEVAHAAALLALKTAETTGNAAPLLVLASALDSRRYQLLVQWCRAYSPVSIDLAKKAHQVQFHRDKDRKIRPFDIAGAKANPFFKPKRH